MGSGLPAAEAITLALEAISDRAPERLRPLLADRVVVRTDRSEHEGIGAVLAWAQKGYEHLDRRYAIGRIEEREGRFLVTARVEYVWRESGEVGDSSPVWLVFGLDRELIGEISLHDERAEAEGAVVG